MALILEANYSKKIGLPGYSSHQFSLSLKTELNDPTKIHAESTRLYSMLQTSADECLQKVGWLPDGKPANGNGNGHADGNGHNGKWNCSEKQQNLITRLINENRLDEKSIDQLAQERFGKTLLQLNKLEASGLIDELFENYGDRNGNGHQRFNGRATEPR
jgi:hypothetical protein